MVKCNTLNTTEIQYVVENRADMTEQQQNAINMQSGFTLLELLAVIAIAAVLLGVGVPSMSNFIDNSRRAAGTTELLIAMNMARSEALKQHRHVTVCKSADGENCGTGGVAWEDGWIVFVNNSSLTVSQRNSGEQLLYVSPAMNGGAAIDSTAAIADRVSFRPSGRAAANGLFTWCDDRGAEEARAVWILPSGRAAVSTTTPTGEALSCS